MTNVGIRDAVVRYAIGILLLAALFYPDMDWRFEPWGNWKHALTALGIVLVATALSHVCPAYWIFGINTCGKEACKNSRDGQP
jgi:hypothetical protein